MNIFKLSFVSTLTALLLVFSILAPQVVKLSHAVYEHESVACNELGEVHAHEIEIDCDFQKFKLSPQHYTGFNKIQKLVTTLTKEKDQNHYSFLSKYQKLHFDLRGPPISYYNSVC